MITWIYSEGDISTLKSNSSFMSCVKVFHVTILQKCGFSLCTQFNIVCLDQNVTRKHALDWIMWHLGTLSIYRFRDTSEDKVKVSLLLSATPSAQIWNSLIPYVQVVSYPTRWSFSFILGPLHWSSNIQWTKKYSAVMYYPPLYTLIARTIVSQQNSACWFLHDLFSLFVFNFKIYRYLRFASIFFSKMGYIHIVIFSLNNGSSCQERINSLGPVTSMFTRISDIEFIREGQVFKRWRQLQKGSKLYK